MSFSHPGPTATKLKILTNTSYLAVCGQKPHRAEKNVPATTGASKPIAPDLTSGQFQVKEAISEHPDSHFL